VANQPIKIDIWDVGQGDCSVLHLSDGSLILIDVGPRGNPIAGWLSKNSTRFIHSIALTHNDADHIGSLNSVIASCKNRIGTIYFLEDRNRQTVVFRKLIQLLDTALKQNQISRVRRLEVPESIWTDPSSGCSLDVRYPDVLQNLQSSSSNEASGMLTFSISGKVKILWPGDNKVENVALECAGSQPDIMVGPHHGSPEDRRHRNIVAWLKLIGAKKTVMSVGSDNQYRHPQVGYMKKLRRAGSEIVCTQLTPRCESRSKLRHVIMSHGPLGLPQPNSGYSCRGVIRLSVTGTILVPDTLLDDRHHEEIKRLASPRCIACT
jgi:competence protein ComEC